MIPLEVLIHDLKKKQSFFKTFFDFIKFKQQKISYIAKRRLEIGQYFRCFDSQLRIKRRIKLVIMIKIGFKIERKPNLPLDSLNL